MERFSLAIKIDIRNVTSMCGPTNLTIKATTLGVTYKLRKKVNKMISIQDINGKTTDENKPYQKGLKAIIVKCTRKTYYKTAKQENKVLYHMALADTNGYIKATCYNEDYLPLTKENNNILIRNFMVRNNSILITKQTRITRIPPFQIPQDVVQEATFLLQPPAPPASPIKAIREAKLKTIMTVCETITEEEPIKKVFIGGQDTELKSITIKDSTDYIKITLWREATEFPITIGEYIKITHVMVHEFNDEKILNTTRHSKLQTTEAPPEKITIHIYGIEKTTREIKH
ncbi:hypothetical protein NDU88_002295 [Pleurodeles waltl]|uniref:HIN-200 domain-containing protein n=1 Tax=Pleurodeles waltl TaxID=8319 RepID=A0AAV7KSG5_PLEWA|nr:hypothetical protein NDU88_002295 [Pleurodeles waltl]